METMTPGALARSPFTMKQVRIFCERASKVTTNNELIFFAQTPDGLYPLFVQRFWLKHLLLFQGDGMMLERLISSGESCFHRSWKLRRLRVRILKALRSVELESLAYDEEPVTFQLRSPRRAIRTRAVVEAESENEPIANVFTQTFEEERIWAAWQQKNRSTTLEIGEVA